MRPIDAEAYEADVRKRYCKHCDNGKGVRCRVCWIDDMLGEIEAAPTIEAKPVVHAHWNADGRCTNCGEHAPFFAYADDWYETKYCHGCGAQMDELVSKTEELNHIAEAGKKEPICGDAQKGE